MKSPEPERRNLGKIIASLRFPDHRRAAAVAETMTSEGARRIDGGALEALDSMFSKLPSPPHAEDASSRAVFEERRRVEEEGVPEQSTGQRPGAEPMKYERMAMLQDAQFLAASRRLAAEKALKEARALESRIAEEAEQLRAADALAAEMQLLVEAAERAAAHKEALRDEVYAAQAHCTRLPTDARLPNLRVTFCWQPRRPRRWRLRAWKRFFRVHETHSLRSTPRSRRRRPSSRRRISAKPPLEKRRSGRIRPWPPRTGPAKKRKRPFEFSNSTAPGPAVMHPYWILPNSCVRWRRLSARLVRPPPAS